MASSIQSINPSIRFFLPVNYKEVNYTFSIIVTKYGDQWIWVKHKDRTTWELPAGHLEHGETALQAAHRELFEETGALEYKIQSITAYEGIMNGSPVFGHIFLAVVAKLGPLPNFEIKEIAFFDDLPEQLTYPAIQTLFFSYVLDTGKV
jgi:8-oxo-dGTP diphosphatase